MRIYNFHGDRSGFERLAIVLEVATRSPCSFEVDVHGSFLPRAVVQKAIKSRIADIKYS
jgi:hypothetical protein